MSAILSAGRSGVDYAAMRSQQDRMARELEDELADAATFLRNLPTFGPLHSIAFKLLVAVDAPSN